MISADPLTLQTAATQQVAPVHVEAPPAPKPVMPPDNSHVQIWMAMMAASAKTAEAILTLRIASAPDV